MTTYDLKCRMKDTIIELRHGSIAEVEADALVSNDDVYLSMSGGVAQAISSAAGPRLQDDIRKYTLPREFGTVIVTGAGSLKSKYVFHALIRDFIKNENVGTIVPDLVRHILELTFLLNIKSVALPLIGSGTMGVPENVIVEYIFNSAMYFLAGRDYKIDKLTIVLYEQEQLQADLETLFKKALDTNEAQKQIRMMQSLFDSLPPTDPLRTTLAQSLVTARQSLQEVFRFEALESNTVVEQTMSEAASATVQEKLLQTLENLRREQARAQALQEADQQRLAELQARERPLAAEGHPELEEIKTRIQHRQQEMDTLSERIANYEQELNFHKRSQRIQLFEILTKRFDLEELQTLCFYLDDALQRVNYDRLEGDNQTAKARSLIEYLERRRQLPALIEVGQRMRDDIEWPII